MRTMKCKYGQCGTCEKLFHPNCPDDDTCYEFDMFTNADRIRAMSDEELAKFLESSHGCPTDGDCEYGRHAKIESCVKHWENLLRQPAEGEQYD